MQYSKKGVCAIIVTFNPDNRLLVNCAKLQYQVDAIVIVDNDSRENIVKIINDAGFHKITIIQNKTNVGLAAALNIGIRYVKDKYRWILTFDQDSIVTDSYVRFLLEAYDSYPNKNALAIIAPFYKDQITGSIKYFRNKMRDENILYATATTTITSGNLIASHIFNNVGFFREDFFIDYIDNEFCLRCRKYGYDIIESTKAYLLHCVGSPRRQYKLLWKNPISSNHTPLRRYYNTRNRIVVYRQYITIHTRWVLYDIYMMFKDMVKVLIYEEDVMSKYCWMLRGVHDAALNKMGPIGNKINMRLL